jgi:4-amino-4-deoxy-L-arabinose transferase-like glycosyltransferase
MLNKTRLIWSAALVISLSLSIFAAFRGGYIGPDYYTHFARLTEWQKVFDFGASNPPGYYLIGYGLFSIIGPRNAFPITLAIIQAALNALALWFFFLYSQRRFQSSLLHLSFVLFLTFLPVRVIHATTIGADCTSIPLFVLLLFVFDKFLSDSTSTPQNAVLLGFGLGIANFTKYSFMALIPALLLVFICIWRKRRWKLQRFVAISALALALPSAIALASFWESARVHGYNTEKHWLPKGMMPDMNFKDLFTVKINDAQLFQAPEYFKREILTPHNHSYLALSHMGIFTDPMNLFQDLSVPQRFGSVLIPDQKTRRPWKTSVMEVSILFGTVWTLLALIGTPWSSLRAFGHLLKDKLEREDCAMLLGGAYFLLMFLPIPFVHGGALFGYWTPRLVLPALLCFFLAGFLLIDQTLAKKVKNSGFLLLMLVAVQSATEIALLA